MIYYKNLGCNTYDDIQKYINEIKKENIKNKEENEIKQDDKMRLRNSTIISTNKLTEMQKNNDKKKKWCIQIDFWNNFYWINICYIHKWNIFI